MDEIGTSSAQPRVVMAPEHDRAAILCAIFACDELVAAELKRLALWTGARRRQLLLHQGDDHQRCHIVISGSADIRALGAEGQYVQIATVEPGEFFGCYPGPGVVRADVQAQGAIEFVSFDAAQLSRLARSSCEIGAGLAGILAGQLANVLDRFAARVTLTAAGRVYSRLLALLDPGGAIHPVPAVAALAVQAQTTRETASRAISALERRGIMRREGDMWTVTSPRLLEELVI